MFVSVLRKLIKDFSRSVLLDSGVAAHIPVGGNGCAPRDGGVPVSEVINTWAGGIYWVLWLGAGGLVLRPKALLAVLVVLTAPFPDSRLYQRYSHNLAVVHGVQPPDSRGKAPNSKPKNKEKRKRKRR